MAYSVKSDKKLLLRALQGEILPQPPIWLMRQAGRYLPEYMKTRAQANGFLDLCYAPDLAVEVTLQPIRRYGFDASILFSDILVVPHALGQKVWFEEGVGPKLEPLKSADDIDRLALEHFHDHLAPVYETVGRLREELPAETALIGFAGAPWTVASYMLEGGSSKDFAAAKTWAYAKPELFARVIDLLVEATASYLIRQAEAGAEVLQIFDSWAGVWPEEDLRRWCLEPCKKIIAKVNAAHPDIPIILFPRGVGLAYRNFAVESGAKGLGLDTTVPLKWARDELQSKVTVQGNLDPIMLVAGGDVLDRGVAQILENLSNGPFVFNLGHGIVPQTPPKHVERLMRLVRG
ncbi:uroporphyrinogen decarboxylase [Pelagibius sp. Alg239-R121]|uniref:uroporphyrinogen decarboxylase n=1 Tax=Pelagibius sp. Alg239-R121 TaxID=2993448 RepID=UPI0024A6E789|nr:uroporphyrinogen decarboxylase [Pelagibius sp. Alg239-R121]